MRGWNARGSPRSSWITPCDGAYRVEVEGAPAGGAPLPAGAYAVEDLSGAPFEVLEGGAVVVEGAVP